MGQRNKKGQFIKGHSLGVRFGKGQKGHHTPHTLESRAKMRKARFGIPRPMRRGIKIEALQGDKNPSKKPEVAKKISESLTGKPQPWNRGSNHWNWKGGKCLFDRRLDRKRAREFSNKVFHRDKFICQICLKKGGKLEADNIKPYSLYTSLRWKMSNMRMLCPPCHRKTDTYGIKIFKHKRYNRSHRLHLNDKNN